MLLQFHTSSLRDLCEDQSRAEEGFGNAAASLFSALADIRAANNLQQVPPALIECGMSKNTFNIVAGELRVTFVQNHLEPPVSESGELDAARVTRIKIMGVERDND